MAFLCWSFAVAWFMALKAFAVIFCPSSQWMQTSTTQCFVCSSLNT